MIACGTKFDLDNSIHYVLGNSVRDDGKIWCLRQSDFHHVYIDCEDIQSLSENKLSDIRDICWTCIINAKILQNKNRNIPNDILCCLRS